MSRPLDRMAAQSFPAAVGGLGVILTIFAIADYTLYPPETRIPIFTVDAALALGALYLAWRTRDGRLQPHLVHPLMALVVSLMVANIAIGMLLGAESMESIYLVLAVVGTGSVFLSWRWTAAICAFSYATWVAISWGTPLDWARIQYGLGLLGACGVAMLVVGVRIHTHGNMERLRAEERGLREQLQAVVTGAPIVLFALDGEGRFRFVDGKGLEAVGMTSEQLIGRNIHEVYPATEELSTHLSRALSGHISTSVIQSEESSFLISWGPARGLDGAVAGVVGVATNITDQRRAERELDASRKHMARQERLAALGTLVAGVAHEINNPLAYMKGNTQVTRGLLDSIARGSSLPEGARADVETLVALQASTLQGIERLSHISDSLRSVARSGQKARAPTDVNRVVEMALTVAHPRFRHGLVAVETDLRAATQATGDEAELSQVVLNLLFNAADELSSREDGRIVVRTFDGKDGVVVEVEDNGRGVDPAKHDLIFAPFFTTKSSGTGLGLSISHRIVDDHGGILSFTSRPGCTVFRMLLPQAGEATVQPATREVRVQG